MFGGWQTPAEQYIAEVRGWMQTVGLLEWAAAMDWMCEPFITAKTGLTVLEHQRRTVANYLQLRDAAPDVPWLPVIQGWTYDDYCRCVEMYDAAGVDLRRLPAVGLGSVCRRQGMQLPTDVIRDLSATGIRLHAFGFKVAGLLRCHRQLASADSMAWSKAARKRRMLPDCKHAACNNCVRWAYRWRDRLLRKVETCRPGPLPVELFA